MNELIRLEEAYEFYKKDPEFQAELQTLLNEYAGRPSLLYYAEKMTKDLGGAKIYLKREDLNHTGSHKIEQCTGTGTACKTNGQRTPCNCGDRSRTAWCGNSYGRSIARNGM